MQGTTSFHAITLIVANSVQLAGRSISSHVYDGSGGTLGSATTDDWQLQDRTGSVHAAHAEIQLLDGRFCLVDRCGHTFINHATLPLGRNQRVALRDGDELNIGRCQLRVHLGDRQALQPGNQSLDALITEETDTLGTDEMPLLATQPALATRNDPLDALGEALPGATKDDPLSVLDTPDGATDQESDMSLVNDSAFSTEKGGGSDDLQSRHQAAMYLPTIGKKREKVMDEKLLDDLERSVGEQLNERWQEPPAAAVAQADTTPLLQGLGGKLEFHNREQQQAFLEEAGCTLRATVEGLRKLNRHQDTRYPLRDRRLQPIEDNPLRLEQDYADTLNTLFSAERSPVHLSAPAAVSECLEHQRQHQAAIEDAITQALDTILSAFSPETLLKRFHAYRGANPSTDDEDSWAWSMYHHYYQELNSGRQRGFEKLFWEVFEQAYDRSLRSQQQEDLSCVG